MNRPVGAHDLEVVGPDETGLPCPECGEPGVTRRHYTFQREGAVFIGRSDFCRRCLYLEAAA